MTGKRLLRVQRDAALARAEWAEATVRHLRGLAADRQNYIEMQRDLLRRNGDVIDNLREQLPEVQA